MAKNYEHLSDMERALIQAKLETGCKLRAIARSLQRSASTISGELKRCGWQGQRTWGHQRTWGYENLGSSLALRHSDHPPTTQKQPEFNPSALKLIATNARIHWAIGQFCIKARAWRTSRYGRRHQRLSIWIL